MGAASDPTLPVMEAMVLLLNHHAPGISVGRVAEEQFPHGLK